MRPRTLIASLALLAAAAVPATLAQTRPALANPLPRYEVDPVHSTITFRITHLRVSAFYGRFNEPSGWFAFDPDRAEGSRFEIQVPAENVDTNSSRRDNHLRSPDFFSAREFPTISFKSTRVRKTGAEAYEVTGELSLHGVTKTITIDMEHIGTETYPRRGQLTGFDCSFTIKRSDYGMNYMPDMLGDEVTVRVGLEGQAQ